MVAVATSSGSGSDKRVERSIDTVLTETYRLLTETGIGGFSIDEISRRSGVAKTTIYRHWSSRSALLLEACSRLGGPRHIPDTGNLAHDISALLGNFAEELRTAQWATVLPSIIDAAERDADVADTLAKIHAELMTPFAAVVERGQQSGELPSQVSAREVVARLVGPLFYRRWLSKEPIDDGFVARMVDMVIRNSG